MGVVTVNGGVPAFENGQAVLQLLKIGFMVTCTACLHVFILDHFQSCGESLLLGP